MKAIGYYQNLPINNTEALLDIELPQPTPEGKDLLVKINAIAVNPVDYKVRLNRPAPDNQAVILGWDAVGEVIATGPEANAFTTGDKVYYSGDLTRQGSNAEYQLIDERLVALKPSSLSDAEAAALPLTTITAWELLFEHLGIERQPAVSKQPTHEVLLIVGAAGGVGSILTQLASTITGATVIATASRESSRNWVTKLGADYVVDHTQALGPQIEALNVGAVTHIASLNSTDSYFESYTELLSPFGRIAMIDDPKAPLDVMKLKTKSLSLHIELMFTRSMFQTADMDEQGKLLQQVAELIDQGYLKTTVGKHLGTINATNLKQAHAELESGRAVGKIVLEGF